MVEKTKLEEQEYRDLIDYVTAFAFLSGIALLVLFIIGVLVFQRWLFLEDQTAKQAMQEALTTCDERLFFDDTYYDWEHYSYRSHANEHPFACSGFHKIGYTCDCNDPDLYIAHGVTPPDSLP